MKILEKNVSDEILFNMKGDVMNEILICDCECHVHGQSCMHFMACCELTYEKYINADGSFDKDAFGTSFKKVHGTQPTISVKDGMYVYLAK